MIYCVPSYTIMVYTRDVGKVAANSVKQGGPVFSSLGPRIVFPLDPRAKKCQKRQITIVYAQI
jgi:hypothetical protein